MKLRGILTAVCAAAVLALSTASAQAYHFPRCTHDNNYPAGKFMLTCTKWIIATTTPYSFEALGSNAPGYMSFWVHDDGHEWVASGGDTWCRDYGNHANVRVKENWCNGPLVVTAYTDFGFASIWFTWDKWNGKRAPKQAHTVTG